MEYLGSVPLSRHSSDLMSLQDPLKELYFKYLQARKTGVGADGCQAPSLPGTVEISKTGLKVSTPPSKVLLTRTRWSILETDAPHLLWNIFR